MSSFSPSLPRGRAPGAHGGVPQARAWARPADRGSLAPAAHPGRLCLGGAAGGRDGRCPPRRAAPPPKPVLQEARGHAGRQGAQGRSRAVLAPIPRPARAPGKAALAWAWSRELRYPSCPLRALPSAVIHGTTGGHIRRRSAAPVAQGSERGPTNLEVAAGSPLGWVPGWARGRRPIAGAPPPLPLKSIKTQHPRHLMEEGCRGQVRLPDHGCPGPGWSWGRSCAPRRPRPVGAGGPGGERGVASQRRPRGQDAEAAAEPTLRGSPPPPAAGTVYCGGGEGGAGGRAAGAGRADSFDRPERGRERRLSGARGGGSLIGPHITFQDSDPHIPRWRPGCEALTCGWAWGRQPLPPAPRRPRPGAPGRRGGSEVRPGRRGRGRGRTGRAGGGAGGALRGGRAGNPPQGPGLGAPSPRGGPAPGRAPPRPRPPRRVPGGWAAGSAAKPQPPAQFFQTFGGEGGSPVRIRVPGPARSLALPPGPFPTPFPRPPRPRARSPPLRALACPGELPEDPLCRLPARGRPSRHLAPEPLARMEVGEPGSGLCAAGARPRAASRRSRVFRAGRPCPEAVT